MEITNRRQLSENFGVKDYEPKKAHYVRETEKHFKPRILGLSRQFCPISQISKAQSPQKNQIFSEGFGDQYPFKNMIYFYMNKGILVKSRVLIT